MEQFITTLIGYGPAGVAIGYLIWKIRQLELDIDAKNRRIDELQEKRVDEAIASTSTSNALATSTAEVGDALGRVANEMRDLKQAVERIDRPRR